MWYTERWFILKGSEQLSASAARRISFGRKNIDMTSGNILKILITFAFPLLIGNLFQQLYNTVDSYVVGNYVSKEAFAAVGSVGPIINTAIGTFSGFATGAGVVISQYAGAKDNEKLSLAVHTSILLTSVLAVIFTFAGAFYAPYMLRLMDTPEGVFDEANKYLSIYFYGVAGLMLYNIGAGILRAVGNSVIPLIALILSALTNVVLDLLFVIKYGMGVAGVAWATLIAQALSAVFVLAVLTFSQGAYRIKWTRFRCSLHILKQIATVGAPAALQMAVTSFSNVFVQSYINKFDTNCMAGWSAYNKIDAFAMLPMQSISLSVTTFSGQNFGAGQPERAKRGVRVGIGLSMAITAVILIPIMIFAGNLVAFFNDDPGVIKYGTLFLRFISPFYLLCTINQIISGVLRGAGNTKAPMVIMLASFVAFRQFYLYVFSLISDSVMVIAFAYPAGWLLCSALLVLYYFFSGWEEKRTRITDK